MKRPQIAPSQPWRFPPHEETVLGNGLRVWHFHLPGQHMSTFRLVLPAPLTLEKRDREGVGAIALHAIDEATASHPDGLIGELLERNGASLHGRARYRYTTLGGQAPTRRLRDVLPLFVEVLTEPSYCPADIDLHLESACAHHESQLASPAHATRLALSAAIFGDHRNARPVGGTPATLANVTADAVRLWHRAYFVPGSATLVVAGSGHLDDILDPLAMWMAPSHEIPRPVSPPLLPPASVIVDRRGAVQTDVALASRTITRTDARWPALRVAAHAMVGAFASRLNLELRERLGYTYGVGGGVSPGVAEGEFLVSTSIRADVTGDALSRIVDLLAMPEPLTTAEVADARNFLVGIAPLATETSYDIVGQAAALAGAGLTPDFLNTHFTQLARVDAEEASAVYRELIDPASLSIAVTGEADTLQQSLELLGRDGKLVTP